MRVLVTGATGYLGAAVATALVEAGHDVTALRRPGGLAPLPPGCREAAGDLLAPAGLPAALHGAEAVVHLAGFVKRWTRDRTLFDRVNVGGTASLFEAARAAGVRRILYTSSIVALGPTGGGVADETTPRARTDFRTEYERTKWAALLLARARASSGLPVVVVHPGVVYGPGRATEGNLMEPLLADFASGRLRTRLGRGDRRICYAFIGDVARGHVRALERGVPGREYILGGENVTMGELFALLSELTGRRAPRLAIPYAAAEAAAGALVLLAWLTGRMPDATPGVVSTFRHEWAYACARAQREIGYEVTPLRDGLRATLAALRGGSARRSA